MSTRAVGGEHQRSNLNDGFVRKTLGFLEGYIQRQVVSDGILPPVLVFHSSVEKVLLANGGVNGLEAQPPAILGEGINDELCVRKRRFLSRVFTCCFFVAVVVGVVR